MTGQFEEGSILQIAKAMRTREFLKMDPMNRTEALAMFLVSVAPMAVDLFKLVRIYQNAPLTEEARNVMAEIEECILHEFWENFGKELFDDVQQESRTPNSRNHPGHEESPGGRL